MPVLIVSKEVDCVVRRNIERLRWLYPSALVHVVARHCPRELNASFICIPEAQLLPISLTAISRRVASRGAVAGAMGTWYYQQVLKLGAVASGNLSARTDLVRIFDGDSVVQRRFAWAQRSGGEIFDTCGKAVALNNQYYAEGWRCLAGEALVGDSSLVTHGMTFNRTTVRAMLAAMSPGGAPWHQYRWVDALIGCIGNGSQARLGFSEYWSYASFAIRHARRLGAPAPCVRCGESCPRVPTHGLFSRCGLAIEATHALRRPAYVVYENHASGHHR